MSMHWQLFSEHVIYHVELQRKEKKEKEQAKQVSKKLSQLQLQELTKNKGKVQVPVVTSAVQPPTHNSGGQQVKIPAALIMPQKPPVPSFPQIQV